MSAARGGECDAPADGDGEWREVATAEMVGGKGEDSAAENTLTQHLMAEGGDETGANLPIRITVKERKKEGQKSENIIFFVEVNIK